MALSETLSQSKAFTSLQAITVLSNNLDTLLLKPLRDRGEEKVSWLQIFFCQRRPMRSRELFKALEKIGRTIIFRIPDERRFNESFKM
jgi:hypothetical protein